MRRIILKPLNQQVVVLTGDTSGIGLVTGRQLAERGANFFLVARNGDALQAVCAQHRNGSGQAEYSDADVAERVELEGAAEKAVETFGGFDTWVNNARAFIYGRLDRRPTHTRQNDPRLCREGPAVGVLHADSD